MSPGAGKKLSDEDRILWTLVARTAKPLDSRRRVEEEAPVSEARAAAPKARPPADAIRPAPGTLPAQAEGQTGRQKVSQALDAPTRDKLAKGRLQIEGRVDLHGLTQDAAYGLLLDFLRRARAGGVRYVLVITGKGNGSGGILRRQVPAWLSTPPFRALVSSHDLAARQHGGAGALYVRLRRQRPDQ